MGAYFLVLKPSRLFEKTNVRTLNHSPRVILSLLFSPSTLDIGMV